MVRSQPVKRAESSEDSCSDDDSYKKTPKGSVSKAKASATKASANKAAATKAKTSAATATKRKKNEAADSDVEEDAEKEKIVKKSKKDIKHEAVMVTYLIDDTMPELQAAYHNKSASVLMSDLLDLNLNLRKTDVGFFI